MTSFEFIFTLIIVSRGMSYLRGPTIKMQGRSGDIYDAVGQVRLPSDIFKISRNN